MPTKQNKGEQSILPVVALLAGASIWGLLWYPFRYLDHAGVSGPAATWITYAIAVLAGGVLLGKHLRLSRVRVEPKLLIGIGLFAGWTNLAYVLGVIHGEIMRVMLLFYLAPLWTILFSRFLLGEVLTVHGYLVIAFSFGGAIVMLWQPEKGFLLPASYSDWMGLSAGFMFALTNVLSRKDQYHDVQLKSMAVWIGGASVAFAYSFCFSDGLAPDNIPMDIWLVLLGVGLVVFALSLIMQYGITHTAANRAIVIMLFELVAAAIGAYFLAGEAMTLREWMGGVMIVSASLFSARMNRRMS